MIFCLVIIHKFGILTKVLHAILQKDWLKESESRSLAGNAEDILLPIGANNHK